MAKRRAFPQGKDVARTARDEGEAPGPLLLVPVSAAAPLSAPVPAPFPIVGMGASAGGLEAFHQLLAGISVDSGMAFVVIQHLDPTHSSLLAEVLRRSTPMPVTQAQHGERAEPNHVYVIPPDADISIAGGLFVLVRRTENDAKPHLPIDHFFTALAAERGPRAIGVVLSGSASDGTEGLRAIKAEGGITFAQDPKTAKFSGMPTSAMDAGVVDYALPIPGVARELERLSKHPYLSAANLATVPIGAPQGAAQDEGTAGSGPRENHTSTITGIMSLIKTVVGVDFKEYKFPTFDRRLARRMALRRVEGQASYLRLLEADPDEVRALCEDTLIHVSSFFRDPEVFEAVNATVFPQILEQKADGSPIRIWVAGCSTGEEVYSLAIALLDHLGDGAHRHPIQIFGSDLSERAIQKARSANFADGTMGGISEDRRRRYFTKNDTGYRVNKNVRDLCVFVRHDLARDAPFSKMDLLSCRNVLIYFDQSLQKRVLPTFHYSLNQPGFLLLGRTENIAGFLQLFTVANEASKIFARSAGPSSLRFAPRADPAPLPTAPVALDASQFPRRSGDIARHLDALILARYAPPGVLVNEKMDILHFRGQTGSFLQAAPGEPQSNLIKMARRGLRAQLQATLARVKKEMAPVRTADVEVDQDGFTRKCDIVAMPFAGFPDSQEQLFVVLFEEVSPDGTRTIPPGESAVSEVASSEDAARIPKLEHELSATTEYLHSLIEEHSRTNEDLGSANEELVSGNEELQSLNEELEAAKEELQSTNEELTTVNDELNVRNMEIGQSNSDLVNVLDTVNLPIVIVDKKRIIRRFTTKASTLFSVSPADIGRLFDDIKPRLSVADLDQQIAEVITSSVSKESEVQDREGRWYRMQVRPYTAADNQVDGAVVSLFDIDALKHHLAKAEEARADAERADRAKDDFLAVLSHELRTPLAALLMQSQLLRQIGENAEKRERACSAIERSTKMQVQLVDDLLDVSRIVTGKMRVNLQPLNFVTIVQSALDSVAPLAQGNSISLRASLDGSLPRISGDRVRLEQVVCNLLVNAIKFTPEGGRVDVALQSVDGQARLKVTDTGMGIEPDFLPRIFDRLTQKDSSSTRSHAGLGLGLAIVHYLVEAHGGSVTAESAGLGQGATFQLSFPLDAVAVEAGDVLVQQAHSSYPPDHMAGRLAGRRVLVVEDDLEIREALGEMLTQAGADVMTAASSMSGLAMFKQFQPDALLCDIAMPAEDGYAFIRRIRGLGSVRGGQIPAIALTALSGEAHRRRALAAGFQMLLTKPVDMAALTGALVGLLAEGWPFPDSPHGPAAPAAG